MVSDTERRSGDPIPASTVKALRDRLRLSQQQLAERLGVRGGKAVISGWETGRTVCEGPAAELVLHLLGATRGHSAIPLLAEMSRMWDGGPPWRQISLVPTDRVPIDRDRFVQLFPEVAISSSEHVHGFPFVEVGGDFSIFGLTEAGWVGRLPVSEDDPPMYAWRFTREGDFVYRERLWEVDPLALTRGHVHVGALLELAACAFELYRRVAACIGWTDAAVQAHMALGGVRGRGLIFQRSLAIFDLDAPGRTFVEPEVATPLGLTYGVPQQPEAVLDYAVAVVGELVLRVRPADATTNSLMQQLILRHKWDKDENSPENRTLGFLDKVLK